MGVKTGHDYTYEIVVVDDGSTDGSELYVRQNVPEAEVSFVRLERTSVSCRARARNAGIRASSGEFVVFVDADILVYVDHLLQLDRYFNESSYFLVVGNRTFSSGSVSFAEQHDFGIPQDDLDFRYNICLGNSFNVRAMKYPWAMVYTCNMAIKRSIIEALGGFDEKFVEWGLEDLEFGYRCQQYGALMCVNPFMQVVHQGRDTRDDLLGGGERLLQYRRNIQYFLKKHPFALDMAREKAIDLLTTGEDLCVPENKIHSTSVFVFTHISGDTIELKNSVEKALFGGGEAVIYDYSTCSSLDVWVQTDEARNAFVRYYPMLKIYQKDVEMLLTKYAHGVVSDTAGPLSYS